MVKELVDFGYLDFAPDPSDNRAKLVVYTPL
jgi:DNA-binding MarR family transcriptional regulator